MKLIAGFLIVRMRIGRKGIIIIFMYRPNFHLIFNLFFIKHPGDMVK